MRPSRTTTAASGTGGPPFPSSNWPFVMTVVPVASFMGGPSERTEEREEYAERCRSVLPVDEVPDAGQVDAGALWQRGGERVGVGRRQHPAAGRVGDDEQGRAPDG